MSEQDRRQLLQLGDQIRKQLEAAGVPDALRIRLQAIGFVADGLSLNPNATADDVEHIANALSALASEPAESDWMSCGFDHLDKKRRSAVGVVTSFAAVPLHSIEAEDFMNWFSRAQVVVAELFAQEEEVIRLIGMPDSEKRRHILEHDRLLGIFNQVYLDSMEHKKTMAYEVFGTLWKEIEKHVKEFDVELRTYAPHVE